MLTSFQESHKTIVKASHPTPDLMIGYLIDLVVNPETGIIVALWINGLEGKRLLLPEDVLHWNQEEISIQDVQDLSPAESLPKLDKIFKIECPILKTNVYTPAQKKPIGRVTNFIFDTLSPRILSIEVATGFLGIHKIIIPKNRITKITEEGIFITDNRLKMKLEAEKKLAKHLEALKKVPEMDFRDR